MKSEAPNATEWHGCEWHAVMQVISTTYGQKAQFIVSGPTHYDITQGKLGAYTWFHIGVDAAIDYWAVILLLPIGQRWMTFDVVETWLDFRKSVIISAYPVVISLRGGALSWSLQHVSNANVDTWDTVPTFENVDWKYNWTIMVSPAAFNMIILLIVRVSEWWWWWLFMTLNIQAICAFFLKFMRNSHYYLYSFGWSCSLFLCWCVTTSR